MHGRNGDAKALRDRAHDLCHKPEGQTAHVLVDCVGYNSADAQMIESARPPDSEAVIRWHGGIQKAVIFPYIVSEDDGSLFVHLAGRHTEPGMPILLCEFCSKFAVGD